MTTWIKTGEGRSEIELRTRRLPANLRSILLLVDGQRGEEELREMARGLRAPEDVLDQLAAVGLIAPVQGAAATPPAAASPAAADAGPAGVERYTRLYARLTEDIRNYLGLKGYFLQLKVERCANADELLALLPEVANAFARTRSQALATRWLGEMQAQDA